MVVSRSSVVPAVWWALILVRAVAAGIACLSNPCLHGICIDDINSTYSCYCVDGYTGVQCQTNWDECWSDPCQNGGTCFDGIASYNCSCPDGFIGENCEVNFNECESNPCANNGTCIDLANGYTCACVPGFSGEHCELDIAVCNVTDEVRCHNGGQCIEGPGFKFYCRCAPGWTGKKCEDQIDECESSPCQNAGVCIDAHADYMCACAFGYTGKNCEVQIEFCDENSCSNDALCVVEDGTRVCYCVPDFHGERCELQYDECMLGPRCMNGGTCIDGVDNFTCSCPPMLTGLFCECLIIDDGDLDCQYVSPTPIPQSTLSIFTSFTDTIPTTEIITTLSEYNDTIPRTISSETENEFWMTTSTVGGTTISANVETTTEIIELITTTAKGEDEELVPTTLNVELTKTTVEESDTTQTITKATEESESITEAIAKETTTQCSESCEISTLLPIPANATELTTVYANETITTEITTLLITLETTLVERTTVPAVETTIPYEKDTTTAKMFTDTPTEHGVTDVLMRTSTTSTPEVTEAITVIETTHITTTKENVLTTEEHVSTTEESECSDDVCHGHGTCVNTVHGSRCNCIFNYGGRFCDEKISITSAAFGKNTFITHNLQNATSINITFNAKTLITDGQIMHVNIAKDVYMQLYMVFGLLKFKFSCGYQTMLLSELNTYVNRGYPMKIESRLDLYPKEQYCNATLRLNNTVAMSGGQVANISTLHQNTTVYLGNAPASRNETLMPFIGCIGDLVVNGVEREVFGDAIDAGKVTECSSLSCLSSPCLNGGSCSDHGDNYTCSCGNGWMGAICNVSVCEHNPCQSGGSCVRHPGSGFLCLCPYGKHGIFCEYNVDITRPSLAPISSGVSSYLTYALSSSAINSDRFDLRLRFQTTDFDQIALLAFVGQNGKHDSRSQHLVLTFVKGYVMLTWNMGAGSRRVFTSRALTPRRGGHTVRVWRRGRNGGFSVDGRHNVSGNAPASETKMALVPYVYIGGHPSKDFSELPHDLPLHNGWRGCIWEVGGQAIGSSKPVGGRGVGQCGVAQCTSKSCNAPKGVCIHSPATYGCICNDGWFGATCSSTKSPCDRSVSQCKGHCVMTADRVAQCDCPYGKTGPNCDKDLIPTDVLFTGIRSYAELHPRPISSVSLSLEAEIKPNKERGLVLFTQTPHFYTALSLQGGMLEYRWTDHLSGMTSLVRSSVVITNAQWHSVKAGRYGSRLYVWVDGSLSTEAMLAHAYPHTQTNASIIVGGAKDLATLPFDVMSGPPESFNGCVRSLHVNNIVLPLEKQNIREGQNLEDCDGTPCGSEACGGGTCIIENGLPRCACSLSTTEGGLGGRCRRHATCAQSSCKPPAGRCRGNTCVCYSGYAGIDCEQKINVSMPQFNGDGLLSLSRRKEHFGEQRLGQAGRPSYVALNFTTAEPDGLLLWAGMVTNYLAVGLENGYLKLVWSLRHDNSSIEVFNTKLPEPSRFFSRVLPNAGYLADAEWHTLVLGLEKHNVTVTLDQLLVYVDEPGLTANLDYDSVDLYIGGITEDQRAKKVFPHNFKGCVDRISTGEQSVLVNYTEIYSENIKSCQLFP